MSDSQFFLRIAVVAFMPLLGCDSPAAKQKTVETRQTIRKTTQNVLKLSDALENGGVVSELRITGQGLEVVSEAYSTSVGEIGILAVTQAMNLYQAEFGEFPKSYDEFMLKIIKKDQPDGTSLAMLPYYQEYAYDEKAKKLVVVEFPAKKEQRQKETTGASGL